jgi:hypothetical protein
MSDRRRPLRVICLVLISLALLPVSAYAGYTYLGDNYSQDFNNATQGKVCDGEYDGNGVYGQFRRANTDTIYVLSDNSGPGDTCPRSPVFSTRITAHRVCESRLFADPCSAWYYP